MKTLGVVIGRFQVDELTLGHWEFLNEVFDQSDEVLALIGTRSSPPTATNPLTYDSVATMVKGERKTIHTLPIADVRSHELWSQNVDTLIGTVAHNLNVEQVTLYTGRDGFNPYYSGRYPVVEVKGTMDDICGTHCRATIGAKLEHNRDFRKGIIWALHNLPHRIYLTVDAALFHNTGEKINILLGRKPGEDKWRLPGGFVEPHETFSNTAARELREETGCMSEDRWKMIGDFEVDDWRIRRNLGVSHKTILMAGWHSFGFGEAGDDLEEVKWWDVDNLWLNPNMLMPEHVQFVTPILRYLESVNV